MNFTTFEFLLFLAIFFPIYFILPKKLQKFALLFFNFYYISFYKIEFLYFILGISTLFYLFGILIEKYKNSKFILWWGGTDIFKIFSLPPNKIIHSIYLLEFFGK